MAFDAATEWDVRTTGSDTNGGGFKVGSGGTDYSQQDSPQVTYTDLVIDGTTNTKCTSANTPFTSAHVGNIINVTGGTGFTVQRVQVVSVATGVATCDKSLGTLGSTGGQGKLGGALATPGLAAGLSVSGNTIHIKAGTYTLSGSTNVAGGRISTSNPKIIGYSSTHGDNGTKPVLQATTGNTSLTNVQRVENVVVDGNNVASSSGIYGGRVFNCESKRHASYGIAQAEVTMCSSHNNGGIGFDSCSVLNSCVSYSNTGIGIKGGQPVRCKSYSNGSHGFSDFSLCSGCTAYGNTGTGFYFGSSNTHSSCINCISYGNNYGFQGTSGYVFHISYCAAGNSGVDDWNSSISSGLRMGNVTLSADPFTNAAGGDFSLNNTAGGGAACKGAGYQVS